MLVAVFCDVSIGSPGLVCVAADEGKIGMLLAKGELKPEAPRNGLLLRGGPTEAIELSSAKQCYISVRCERSRILHSRSKPVCARRSSKVCLQLIAGVRVICMFDARTLKSNENCRPSSLAPTRRLHRVLLRSLRSGALLLQYLWMSLISVESGFEVKIALRPSSG
jgi:hypothetical protein